MAQRIWCTGFVRHLIEGGHQPWVAQVYVPSE